MTDSRNFPVVDQLIEAGSNQERAGILLRLSDGVVYERGHEIGLWCMHNGFAGGHLHLQQRIVAMLRVRDAHGLLDDYTATQLELDRQALSRFAAGGLQSV